MGLDSLMAIELKNGVETDLGVTLPLASLLQGPTLDSSRRSSVRPALGRGSGGAARRGSAPVGRGRERPSRRASVLLWGGSTILTRGARLSTWSAPRPDPPARSTSTPFRRAVAQQLVDRHPSRSGPPFRVTQDRPGGPAGRAAHCGRLLFIRRLLQRRPTELASVGFPTKARPTVRPGGLARSSASSCFRRSDSAEHALTLLAVHHAVADFWSIAVLLDELGRIYPAELAGRDPGTASHSRCALRRLLRWQAETRRQPRGAVEHLVLAATQLCARSPGLSLPADRPRPPVQTSAALARL